MEVLIGILGIAVLMDILHYKIPNWCIAPGMAAGLCMTYAGHGWQGLFIALTQTAVIFAVFYPVYLLKGIGAGDVKLFMLLGCYMGQMQLWHCIGAAMVIAGCMVLVKLMFLSESRERLKYCGRYMRKVLMTGAVDEYTPAGTKAGVVRLSVPVMCSVLLCMKGIVV